MADSKISFNFDLNITYEIANRKSQIANRKSQTINNHQSFFDGCTDAMLRVFNFLQGNKLIEGRREASRLYILLIMITISTNTYAQGNLNLTLLPKTYVGNYNISCHGATNGEIEIQITGGTAPYSILWNNSSTANPLLNLGADTYSVIVTDANNASVADTITLLQPPALGYTLEVSQFGEYNLAFYGSTLGVIKINGTGGTPSYSVVWSDNNTELIRDSLSAGAYTFVLSDANGCTVNGNKTLTQPSVLGSSTSLIHGTSCFGGEDGAAQVTANGGIAPYSYVWDNGNFTSSPEDLSPGWHVVHITDDADNHHTDSVLVTQAAEMDATISKSSYPNNFNVSCYNCFNGTLDATATGGTAPYNYEWIWQDNSIGTTSNLSNLGGGEYELVVTDQNNCRFRTTVSMKEPERQDWSMTGNSGTDPATQFIGTTDSVDVVFKSNNIEQLKISQDHSKVSSGNILIGDSLGIFSRIDSSGNKMLLFGSEKSLRGSWPTEPISFCGQAGFRYQNIFKGYIFTYNELLQPQLSIGADGNNGLIELGAGETATPGVNPRLLINSYCGNSVYVGNPQGGELIANFRLGINNGGVFDVTQNFKLHVEGNSHLNGSVRIGDETNDETNLKLAVEGQILARQIKVVPQANSIWPDYVFEKDYSLLSFEALRNFLVKNKHLPEIPSEAEMKEIGHYNLAGMDASILKKLEESYLYILQLEARIAALEKTATKN